MSSENKAVQQRRKFRDLGVTELDSDTARPVRRQLLAVVMSTMEEVKHGEGQIIIAGRMPDSHRRGLIYDLGKNGLRKRVQVERGFPYHNGEALVVGTRILVSERTNKKVG